MAKTFHRGTAEPKAQPLPQKTTTVSPKELQQIKDASFAAGKKDGLVEGHIQLVAEVETILAKELGFPSREELVNSGKMPALWIATLFKYHGEDYEEHIRRKVKEAEPRRQ